MTSVEVAVLQRSPLLRRRPRLFATAADEPRARRASDVILLAGSVLTLAAISLAAVPQPGITRALTDLLDGLPHFLDAVWQVLTDLLVVLAALLFVGAIVRRRGSIVRDLALSAVLTTGVALVVGRIVGGSWPVEWDSIRSVGPPPWYPSLRLAVPAAPSARPWVSASCC